MKSGSSTSPLVSPFQPESYLCDLEYKSLMHKLICFFRNTLLRRPRPFLSLILYGLRRSLVIVSLNFDYVLFAGAPDKQPSCLYSSSLRGLGPNNFSWGFPLLNSFCAFNKIFSTNVLALISFIFA